MSATRLMQGRHGRITSAQKIVGDLGLSPGAASAIKDAFVRPELFDATFKFDRKEFDAFLLFRSVELDNGVMLTAANASFDSVIHSEQIRRSGVTRYSTEGNIVSEKLRKTR